MNERNLHIELIEKYLDNDLDMNEVKLFHETLENNEAFVRELNDMELLIDGIRKTASQTTIEEKLERFETSMKLMEDEEKTETRTSLLNFDSIKKYSWAIAASITLLLVSSIALININQTPSNKKLYAEYYTPFENHGNRRSPDKTDQNYWKDALYYYDNAQYEKALENFNNIIISDFKAVTNDPRFALYNIYKGNTLMMLNRHEDAIPIFKGMILDEDAMIIQAKWYLSMCYLYKNDTQNLVPLLKEISEVHASSKSNKAKKILSRIN